MYDQEINEKFEKAASGELGSIEPRSACDLRGPRGECMLHWALFHGGWRWALDWLDLGLGMPDDDAGNSPMHWWAMGSKRWFMELGDGMDAPAKARLIDRLSAMADRVDAFGRDPLGLACHGLHAREIAVYIDAFPEAARRGARLATGVDLSLADALLCRGIFCTDELDEALRVARVDPPSLQMPPCLGASGVWDQGLWNKALAGAAHPRQRARAEALAIAKASSLGSEQPSATRL